MSDENNIIHANGLFDPTAKRIRKESIAKGNDSGAIFSFEDQLIKDGWKVEFYAFKLEELTAYVDYDNKSMYVNIDSAYYAAMLMDRIKLNLDPGAPSSGCYKYSYLNGELNKYSDGTGEYHHLILSVSPIDKMIDYDSIPEPKKSVLTVKLSED